MKNIRYFAYGSNMSLRRLRDRVPSAVMVGAAILEHHRLVFHKRGMDGSAKCDVVPSTAPGDCVHGVLFDLDEDHIRLLDMAEGNGFAYIRKTVETACKGGLRRRAECYFAIDTQSGMTPYEWYLDHIIVGALEANLPGWYVQRLREIESICDLDEQRASRELSIYAG